MICLKPCNNLANYKLRTVHTRLSSLLIPAAKLRGFLKSPPGLIIYFKASQDSLETITLMFTVYYREKIQMRISQRRKCIGWSLAKVPEV